MPDIKNEPFVIGLIADILDYLNRNPLARGVITARTIAGLRVTIKVENENIAHCDP